MSAPSPSPAPSPRRETLQLRAAGRPRIALQRQRAGTGADAHLGHVIYVHGSTFGADLSVFFPLDGRSWADALCDAGLDVWGFDFTGYGGSDGYAQCEGAPAGGLREVLPQLHRVVQAVVERGAGKPLHLLGHSWGATVAAAYMAWLSRLEERVPAPRVASLVLFAPIAARTASAPAPGGYVLGAADAASHYQLTAWAQYRRFIEDVPRGTPQLFAEAHFEAWSRAFLAGDAGAARRTPPAVLTPAGPQQDVRALWSGQALYDAGAVTAPVLLVRGAWDSVCGDADARRLLDALGSRDKACETLPGATHLMHLESGRGPLYNTVNAFLMGSAR